MPRHNATAKNKDANIKSSAVSKWRKIVKGATVKHD
jgi:hypothetical protein